MDGVRASLDLHFRLTFRRQGALAVGEGDELGRIDALIRKESKKMPGRRFSSEFFEGVLTSSVPTAPCSDKDDELEVMPIGDHVHRHGSVDWHLEDDAEFAGLAHQDVAAERGVFRDFAGCGCRRCSRQW